MAHIDLDDGAVFGQRPAAMAPVFRAGQAQIDEPARPRPALPKFCRVNAGQIFRTIFLVMLCVGFWQIPHAERFAPKAAVAAPSLKPF
jgi:hypothetical protein